MEKCSFCENKFTPHRGASSPILLSWCMDQTGEWWFIYAGEMECHECRRRKISAGTWKINLAREEKC